MKKEKGEKKGQKEEKEKKTSLDQQTHRDALCFFQLDFKNSNTNEKKGKKEKKGTKNGPPRKK